ncbi:conserved hypothetical protein [Frankia sp. AiPs1]|uniref:hypothetical protein n=1 Tax=Frankia sp. AiPa1 TaxID=573492 RepID=UPI00202AEFD5|nr:hypothetical protein [Frankia sp. AiPa1]MCL9762214.1 hypothetical protein [Frankia sp. AiPa1]
MAWQTSAVAPLCQFGRHGAEILIRYRYAGTPVLLAIPHPVWLAIVETLRADTPGELGTGWSRWHGTEGGAVLVALRQGHVHLGFGYVQPVSLRMPASVWRQITAAIRARAVDRLPAVDATEAASARRAVP